MSPGLRQVADLVLRALLDGHGLLHSTDLGATWKAVALPTGSVSLQVFGGPGATVYAFDDIGRVYTSSDGGATWRNLTLSQDVLVGSGFALDPLTVWTVTQHGAVLTTATGGL